MNDNAFISSDNTDMRQSRTTLQNKSRWKRMTLAGFSAFILVILTISIYWSQQPASFDVKTAALDMVNGNESQLVPGAITVSSIGKIARTLLEKPGGYLYNDVSIPGIYLDNMPSWEYGVIKEVRDSLRSLRNDFSRSQTQSIESSDLRKADEFLNYNVDSWVLPSSESEYREGIRALDRYFKSLVSGNDQSARFFTRADNLAAYMAVVEKRLGSYAQRLSASVGDSELTAALITETNEQQPAGGKAEVRIQTPWLEIDNIFYEARGYSWALLHTFRALAIEFEPVLRGKNAVISVQQVIRDLEEATKRMWSPIVLNGQGFGFISNHSLVLASYISRANAAVIDLRILLQQG